MEQISIYNFLDPADYLNQLRKNKKKQNPRFSIKAWSHQIGFSSPTIFYEILNKKRYISPSYIPFFVKNLDLTKKEHDYFDYLVNLSRAKKESERKYYLEKIQQIRTLEKIVISEISNLELFQNPLAALLLEIIDQYETPVLGNIRELHKKIRLNCSELEIEVMLYKLIEAGLIEKTSDGLKKKHYFLTTKPDIPSFAVKRFHRNILDIAKKEILEQDINEREYGSHMINIDKKDLPKAKQLVRDFTKSFIKEMEYTSSDNIETYNLSMQLFSLTNSQESPL